MSDTHRAPNSQYLSRVHVLGETKPGRLGTPFGVFDPDSNVYFDQAAKQV